MTAAQGAGLSESERASLAAVFELRRAGVNSNDLNIFAAVEHLIARRERLAAAAALTTAAEAIEAQQAVAETSRDVVQTPLPKGNFDQQAWAFGHAARIVRDLIPQEES